MAPDEVPVLLARLVKERIINRAEALLIQEALSEALAGPSIDPGFARARLLRTVLTLLDGRKR